MKWSQEGQNKIDAFNPWLGRAEGGLYLQVAIIFMSTQTKAQRIYACEKG